MNASDIVNIRDHYSERYRSYLLSLLGSLSQLLMSPVGIRNLRERALQSCASLHTLLMRDMTELQRDAGELVESLLLMTAGVAHDDTVSSFADAMLSELIESLREMSKRDLQQILKTSSEIEMGILLDQTSPHKQILRYAEHQMTIMDRGARRWKSERMVDTMLNMTLFKIFNEVTLYIGDHYFHYDKFGSDDGRFDLTFTIDDYRNLTFREKYFHPNAVRLVTFIKH